MESINKMTKGELVATDGKVLRGSYDRDDRQSTIHMVSAYAAANKVVIGQLKTDAKSNEITAIPVLVKLLYIKGCLVSIDAMGCQNKIAKEIVKNGGDYLLAVKNNQESLANSVKKALSETVNRKLEPGQLTIDQAHGRIEARQYCVLDATMSEDSCQVYRDNGAENLACLRHIALNMLRAEPTKISIRSKRKRAWMKLDF